MKRPQGFDSAHDADREEHTRADRAPKVRGSRKKPVSTQKPAIPQKPVTSRTAVPTKTSVPSKTPVLAREQVPSQKPVRPPNDARVSGARLRASARERRRFERREVRRFTRRNRHRRLAWVVALSIIGLLAGLLVVAVFSPVLALRTITIDGASNVSVDNVRDAIDDQMGTPLALLDYNALRSQLDAFPVIRSFSTEIVPPSTLKVHIVERAPIGVVTSSTGFSVVDPAGVVLESAPRRPDGIPLIDLAGSGTDSVAFTAVVDVILALPESIRSRVDVAQATSKDDVRLVLADAGQRVKWGSSERSALKARVLEELMATQAGKNTLEFDVSAPLSPVVRVG